MFTVHRRVEVEGFKPLTVEFQPCPIPKIDRHAQSLDTTLARSYRKFLKANGVTDTFTFDPKKNPELHEAAVESQADAHSTAKIEFIVSLLRAWDWRPDETSDTDAPVSAEYLSLMPYKQFRELYNVVLGYASGSQVEADKKKSESPPESA